MGDEFGHDGARVCGRFKFVAVDEIFHEFFHIIFAAYDLEPHVFAGVIGVLFTHLVCQRFRQLQDIG